MLFFLSFNGNHLDLHGLTNSFPTRRSSDLTARRNTSTPRRSEYVKTLFTMANNQSRATTALTVSIPPSVNPMPKLQTVEPVFAATTRSEEHTSESSH